jgi:hypothetical protein
VIEPDGVEDPVSPFQMFFMTQIALETDPPSSTTRGATPCWVIGPSVTPQVSHAW